LLGAALCLASPAVTANGSSWQWYPPSGTPGPVKAKGLLLEKEEVVFRDGRVVARFWVKNQTSTEIETSMGFPLSQRRVSKPAWAASVDPRQEMDAARRRLRSFSVEVNQQRVPWRLATSVAGDYPTVIAWTMRYPAGKVTQFTVRYPILYSWYNRSELTFQYITHTGAYWARPIGQATLRFCDRKLMSVYLDLPHGRVWIDGGWRYVTYRWDVAPRDFTVDRKARCLVWQRRNWTPTRADDLHLELGDEPEGNHEFLPEPQKILDTWCAKYDPTLHAGLGWPFLHQATRQLGAELRLDQRLLDEKRLAAAERAAWARLMYATQMGPELDRASPHLRLLVLQRLLDYLGKYPLGVRGKARLDLGTIKYTRGDDEVTHRLGDCFEKGRSRRSGALTAVELRNMAFVRAEGARVKIRLKAALEKLVLLEHERGRRELSPD